MRRIIWSLNRSMNALQSVQGMIAMKQALAEYIAELKQKHPTSTEIRLSNRTPQAPEPLLTMLEELMDQAPAELASALESRRLAMILSLKHCEGTDCVAVVADGPSITLRSGCNQAWSRPRYPVPLTRQEAAIKLAANGTTPEELGVIWTYWADEANA